MTGVCQKTLIFDGDTIRVINSLHAKVSQLHVFAP
jgi:hypothetical protein